MVLEHRGGGLLELQEERVLLIAALEQHDERPGADAADADDLAGEVDDPELLEQVPPIVLQRGPVRAELFVDHLLDLIGVHAGGSGQVPPGYDDRRLGDDPVLAVDDLGEFGQRLQAVAGARLLEILLGGLDRLCGFLVLLGGDDAGGGE